MNKSYVVLSLIYAFTIVQASEQKTSLPRPHRAHIEKELLEFSAYVPVDRTLQNDYTTYLQNRLEEYKKTDISITDLAAMGTLITGGNCADKIYQAKDAEGNHLIHIAVEKTDLPMVQRILTDSNSKLKCSLMVNKKNQSPLDICMQKLEPCCTKDQSNNVVHKILSILIEHTAKVCNDDYKTVCLKKITAAQLVHKTAGCELVLTPELMQCLTPKTKRYVRQYLSTIYRTTTNPIDGNTFTHVLVEKELADELFEWIKQERVSFAKNKAQLTPVDVALAQFRFYTQNAALIDGNKISFEKRKCCLFMLLNYLKIKEGSKATLNHCCDKHIMTTGKNDTIKK